MYPKVTKIMPTEIIFGISCEYLVINPSRNPAKKVKGKVLMTILTPVLAPSLKDVNLECVPGNRMLAPKIKPAAASMTMAKISMDPWIHIPLTLSQNTSFS